MKFRFSSFSWSLIAALALFVLPVQARDVADAANALGVQLLLIEGVREFPEATEAGAIRFACAQDADSVRRLFAERGAPFRESLLRKHAGFRHCHVYYEPTIAGYRALPDDRPITGFVSGIDPASLVGGRKLIGDSLDVAREVLRQIERPVDVTFSVTGDLDPASWPQGMAWAFPDSRHRFQLIASEAAGTHPWGQDVVKAGVAGGELRVLVPRRLFEGRGEDGGLFRPLLESLRDPRYVRSKLSWEGGDLQFVADPKDPSRTVLFHGGASHDYWGANLRHEESSYVLQLEFGVDAAVDLAKIGPHADYLVAFLPAERTVLVAQPVRDDLSLAWSAAVELARIYEGRAPEELRILVDVLRQAKGLDPAPEHLEHARSLVRLLLKAAPEIPTRVSPDFHSRLDAHQARYCPTDATACYQGEGKRTMHREDPALLQDVYDAASDIELEPAVARRFLRIVESQLPNDPDTITNRIEAAAGRIRKMGFRIVRVPYLYSPEASDEGWPGISYTNSLLFEKTLFVPAAGLGEYEQSVFRNLQKKLPEGYRVTPVYARFGLMNNGGVHCVFGIIREPGAQTTVTDD